MNGNSLLVSLALIFSLLVLLCFLLLIDRSHILLNFSDGSALCVNVVVKDNAEGKININFYS